MHLDKEEEEENITMSEGIDNSFGHLKRLFRAVKNKVWYSDPPISESMASIMTKQTIRNQRSGGRGFSVPSAKNVEKIEKEVTASESRETK